MGHIDPSHLRFMSYLLLYPSCPCSCNRGDLLRATSRRVTIVPLFVAANMLSGAKKCETIFYGLIIDSVRRLNNWRYTRILICLIR